MLQTQNLRIAEFASLVTPRQLETQLAPTDAIRQMVQASREAISAMLHGQDTEFRVKPPRCKRL